MKKLVVCRSADVEQISYGEIVDGGVQTYFQGGEAIRIPLLARSPAVVARTHASVSDRL